MTTILPFQGYIQDQVNICLEDNIKRVAINFV